jgi:hypothetical protein
MFADKFAKFLSDFDAEKLEPLFYEHFKYGTADVYIENDEIAASIRWNVSESGYVANIIDLFIKEGAPSTKCMRWFGNRIREKFPSIKYIKFYRRIKLPNSKVRMYKLKSLVKER